MSCLLVRLLKYTEATTQIRKVCVVPSCPTSTVMPPRPRTVCLFHGIGTETRLRLCRNFTACGPSQSSNMDGRDGSINQPSGNVLQRHRRYWCCSETGAVSTPAAMPSLFLFENTLFHTLTPFPSSSTHSAFCLTQLPLSSFSFPCITSLQFN